MNTWGPVNTVMNPWGHRIGGNFVAGLRTVGFSRMALVLISVKRPSRHQGHSEAEIFKLVDNFKYLIRNRIRDLPACSALPQPTALQSASQM